MHHAQSIYFAMLNLHTQIQWENRFINNTGDSCLASIDGADMPIQEPIPFDRKWWSYKLNRAGLRYEIGTRVKTGWIAWTNGPFPPCDWPDLRIAREGLTCALEPWEHCLADSGYVDGNQCSVTPTGGDALLDHQRAKARSRHEACNERLKQWNALNHRCRHSRDKHGKMFYAIANIAQLTIMNGEPSFDAPYQE